MEFKQTAIEGLIEIFPKVWGDSRGAFFESYHKDIFAKNGIDVDFVQDNQSYSEAGVIRGLHLQLGSWAQGKLVRVVQGKVLDVVVDVRPGSVTFGQHASFVLDTQRCNMLYVPPGFLHGFATIDNAIFSYKCTNYYRKAAESGVIYNDPQLGIDWGIEQPLISDKDQQLPSFQAFTKSLLQ
jgi:dTDP-4-dehydrorhamnose 3,5-epimerase